MRMFFCEIVDLLSNYDAFYVRYEGLQICRVLKSMCWSMELQRVQIDVHLSADMEKLVLIIYHYCLEQETLPLLLSTGWFQDSSMTIQSN